MIKVENQVVELSVHLASYEEEKRFNRCTFAREGMWQATVGSKVDDRMRTGFIKLIELALYGYRSMIEFLPQRWQWVASIGKWLKSFVPCLPRCGVR